MFGALTLFSLVRWNQRSCGPVSSWVGEREREWIESETANVK